MSTQKWGSLSLRTASFLEFFDAADANSMKLKAPAAVTTSKTLTLPDGVGSAGQVLTTDGTAGLLTWTTTGNGTVTSVAASGGSTGLSFTGSPITTSGTLTLTGTLAVANGGTGTTTSTGTGSVVLSNSPTLVTPALGTPSALVLTNATGLPLTTGVTGTLPISNGGTGQTTASAAFGALSPLTTKGDVLGFSTVNARIPVGSNGQVLTADSTQTLGLKWATPTTGTVTSIDVSGGTTGLTTSGGPVTTTGTITLAGTLGVANGGTGDTTLTANNLLVGAGTSAVTFIAPGTSGNVLTSNGTTFTSSAPTFKNFKYEWVTADTATVAITHSLGTKDVQVEVYDVSTGATIGVDSVVRTSTSVLTVTASAAPPATDWRVLISALLP